MRFRGPQKYLATQNSVIQALKFNSLELLAFYSCSKTTEVESLSHQINGGAVCFWSAGEGLVCACMWTWVHV